MNPQQLGIKAPSGGFQDLGWYNGYQYYQGSFAPQKGVIHPNSPQQGAGQKVSEEVNRQSAAAQNKSYPEFKAYLDTPAPQQASYSPTPATYTPGTGTGAGMPGIPAGGAQTAGVPNLQAIRDQMINSPEYKAAMADVEKAQAERDRAVSEIQNNPWFSQSTRGGKIASIESDAGRKIQQAQQKLATIQSNNEIAMNIATNQYTMNRQAYQDGLSTFNTLLSAGAFDNASPDALGQWASATGFSVDMIASMVGSKAKQDLKLSTYDDGTNIYSIAMDGSGNVVNRVVIGKSKPTGTAEKKLSEAEITATNIYKLKEMAKAGGTLSQVFGTFQGYLDPTTIYQVYNANSKYGADKGQNMEALDRLGVKLY